MGARPGHPGDRQPRKFFEELREQLIAHAAHEFELDSGAGDGFTKRAHLQRYAEATGRRPAELDGPALPEALAHVWEWYCELDAARGGSGFGVNPIGYAEIRAWAALTGARPTRFEVECLRLLDGAFFTQYRKETAKRRKR